VFAQETLTVPFLFRADMGKNFRAEFQFVYPSPGSEWIAREDYGAVDSTVRKEIALRRISHREHGG